MRAPSFRVTALLLVMVRLGALLRRTTTFRAKSKVVRLFAATPEVPTAAVTPAPATQKKGGKKKELSKYSTSVLLPQTPFDQRANSVKKEPEIQKWWNENSVYEELSKNNAGEKFILHDGPPYANGDLHIGHALNKILKDFINKYQLLQGRKVRYVPGWDCHGLPIELKVLQSLKSKEREGLTPINLRKRAAEYATSAMESQRESFKRYGVWGDWENPYMTLQPEYEAAQINVFGKMVTRGHIYRGKKPVHWSPSSRTALAEAELEYPENHISASIYVGFKATKLSAALLEAQPSLAESDVRVAIWTTTPWTIPANLAVAVNADLEYCIAHHPKVMSGAKLIVAKALVGSLGAKFGLDVASGESMTVETVVKGADLEHTEYQHPLYERVSKIVIGGDYITTDSGTGLVHTAPGHGQEDYLTGLKYGLPLLSPVNDLGCFTEEAGEKFAGMNVLGDGNKAVIAALNKTNVLLKEEAYNHKYPYDWRTKKPTIFRATEQWFASVSSFKKETLEAIENVQWIPVVGKNRISSMTESRGDWCISRQRSWGVPIPVFYDTKTNEPLMTPETLAHIESVFREKGSNAWWEMDTAELLPEGPLREQADQYTKGTDTMDVWFDSGTSWAGVANAREELAYPADIYLEGSDQHRGWFQSSLLTSVAANGIAPYKKVLTHGFVLDEKGYKMSKSLGNVIDPKFVIEGGSNQKLDPAYGADTLRLWISGVDYSGDVCIGKNVLKQSSEAYRKIRNTIRYMLGSLHEFDPTVHSMSLDQLPSLDRYILGKLSHTVAEVQDAFENYQFYKANQVLSSFANIDLSSFYLDIAKDRLYISSKDDPRRLSCQTTIATLLEQFTVIMAPILPHLAEEVWQSIPYKVADKSVFNRGWVLPKDSFPPHEEALWTQLRLVRNDVNKCLETARQAKEVGASMEARVHLHSNESSMQATLQAMKGDSKLLAGSESSTNGVDDLRFVLMVSQVTVADTPEEVVQACPQFHVAGESGESGVVVGVTKASGQKCDRCWYFSESVGEDETHSDACLRCADVLTKQGFEAPPVHVDTAAPAAPVA